MLEDLYRRVDDFFGAAREKGGIVCAMGCTACCQVDLTVFTVEAKNIAKAFSRLGQRTRAAARRRALKGRHCAMLDSRGRCVIYEARPLICRTHGLPLLISGEVDHCPLNFCDKRPERSQVLVLERVNEFLSMAETLSGGDGSRIRIAAIAEGTYPG